MPPKACVSESDACGRRRSMRPWRQRLALALVLLAALRCWAGPGHTGRRRPHHAHHTARHQPEAGLGSARVGGLVSEWSRLQGRAAREDGEEVPLGDGCADILSIPKVALMFLTRGVLHHERTWELWFRNARGLLPLAALKGTGCSDSTLETLARACTPQGSAEGRSPIQEQHLVSVYHHVDAKEQGFQGFAPGSLFHGTDIKERLSVDWGLFTPVEATVALFRAALQDPANAKFLLLSESDIPLYPLQTVWIQLMWEAKSRIAACENTGGWHSERWHPDFGAEAGITFEQFRKSNQWVALNRRHVEVAVNDTVLANAYRRHCAARPWACLSDEHYFSTMLAMKGLEEETDCKGEMMLAVWRGVHGSEEHRHPVSWSIEEITPAKLREMRQSQPLPKCDAQAAMASTAAHFFHVAQLGEGRGLCAAPAAPDYPGSLDYDCTLFARKFKPETAAHVLAVLADCKNGLHILNSQESCQHEGGAGSRRALRAQPP